MIRQAADRNRIERRAGHDRRRGVSLVIALVMLAMLAILAVTVTSAHVATRRLLLRRHHGRQADYLARAGVEFAVAELLAGRGDAFRETFRPTDAGWVEVAVRADAERSGDVEIHSAAVYPDEGIHRVGREVRRVYRVVRDEQGTPRECVFVSGRPTRQPRFVRNDDPHRRVDREKIHAEKLAVVRRMLQRPPGPAPWVVVERGAKKKLMQPGMNLGGPWVVPLLVELLKDDDASVRASAAQALPRFGAEARAALPALRAAAKDEDSGVRQAATEALNELDADSATPDDQS